MTTSHLPSTFAALGDPTRLSIVERLLEQGECSAGKLGAGTGLSAPAVSRHLKVLREAGLVTRRIAGTSRIYAADPSAIGIIGHWALAHRAFWESRLDQLGKALEE